MDYAKLKVDIVGMHCKACELLIEQNISAIPGVKKVNVSHKTGVAEIFYGGGKPDMSKVAGAVGKAGYKIGKSSGQPYISKDLYDYWEVAILAALLFGLYIWGRILGVFDFDFQFSSSPGLFVVFLIGVTAGLSTCMALLGGLVLGVSARHAEAHPEATKIQKFRPHLFFNVGRIFSFAVLGGLMGFVGSAISFTGSVLAFLIVIAGLAMLFMGLKLTELFPALSSINFSLPKGVSKALGFRGEIKEYSHSAAALSGALTFFLPCGFTQTMQLYAVSSGSFVMGASIMSVFALGTAPGLLGIGGAASVVKGGFARIFFKFAGLTVIMFGLINLQGGLNLLGFNSFNFDLKGFVEGDGIGQVEIVDGKQIVRMSQLANGYSPNEFVVKKGIPVKWIIDSKSAYTCAAYLVVPSLNISEILQVGTNIIEFTPLETGNLRFTCSMGMYSGNFKVVDPAPL